MRVLGSRYARDKGINGMVGHVHTRCDDDGFPMAVNVSGAFHYLTVNELEIVEKNEKNAKKTRKKGQI